MMHQTKAYFVPYIIYVEKSEINCNCNELETLWMTDRNVNNGLRIPSNSSRDLKNAKKNTTKIRNIPAHA